MSNHRHDPYFRVDNQSLRHMKLCNAIPKISRQTPLELTRISQRTTLVHCSTGKLYPNPMSPSKALLVFDFDHTIADANSDTWVYRAAPGGSIPDELKSSYVKGRWLDFMNNIFQYLHAQNVPSEHIISTMHACPLTPGFHELLGHLGSHPSKFDCIILSDANNYFIDWILESHKMKNVFSSVMTNKATISPEGLLHVKPFHTHQCPRQGSSLRASM